MKIALIYPPTCDPTAPYLSVPILTAVLRQNGFTVAPIDANVEAYRYLLSRERLLEFRSRLERRLERLERQASLSHAEQLAYLALWNARADGDAAPKAIEQAIQTMRDKERFWDPALYAEAVATIESAMRLISAAHAPLTMDFTAYRTPFSLLSAEEIAADARPERNPFHDYYAGPLSQRLQQEKPDLVGISVAFPGQVQPAFSLAHTLRKTLPGVHITVGGPAVTQIFLRLSGERLEQALGPFHSTVLFEGEDAIVDLAKTLERGDVPPRVIKGTQSKSMAELPAPDFEGLPLDQYLSPELVLPYDPTRGCYWGVCTFCHYGLAEVGTAGYRERPVDLALDHLRQMSAKHGCRIFYFSQDSVAPKTILKMARAIRDAGLPWRWATDMRPEKTLKPELCTELAEGGALSMALGVESGSDRVVKLIDKGIPVETVRHAIQNLAKAGIGVEAMCFTNFPTETYAEAMSTVKMLREEAEGVSLFICGEFDLTHGALVAQQPAQFGLKETWQIDGDELGCGLFYEETKPSKSDLDRERIDDAISRLSEGWLLRRYPWAGSLSTAHTLLYYERFGPDAFRKLRSLPDRGVPGAKPFTASARFDLTAIAEEAMGFEAEVWHRMVRELRKVSRALHRELTEKLPSAKPSPGRYRLQAGADPVLIASTHSKKQASRRGRRPSHASNSTKSKERRS